MMLIEPSVTAITRVAPAMFSQESEPMGPITTK
jgi:hypothetical protein